MRQDNQMLFRSIFEHASAGMAVVDRGGHIAHCNRALCDMFGYERDEFEGRLFADMLEPEENSRVEPELISLAACRTGLGEQRRHDSALQRSLRVRASTADEPPLMRS